LREPVVRDGQWRLLECRPAWEGNGSWDNFIAYAWEVEESERRLIVVNYAEQQSQCYVSLPFSELTGLPVQLEDLTGSARYDREGNDLVSGGLYLDMPPWSYHVFQVITSSEQVAKEKSPRLRKSA
jgi:hypothetical protein